MNKLVFLALGFLIASALYANLLLLYLPTSCKTAPEPSQTAVPQLPNSSFSPIERVVPVVAVDTATKQGIVGNLTLRLIPGNSNVLVDTNPFVDTDLQYSCSLAITVAKLKTKNYAPNYDFVISFNVPSQVVGGDSAGAATTIAAISTLTGRRLKPSVMVTGTINGDGSIGRVGGILEKAEAAAKAGYKQFLVPEGQAKITYYERVVEPEDLGFGFIFFNRKYVPKTIDLRKVAKEEWGLDVKEVSTIDDVIKYMLE